MSILGPLWNEMEWKEYKRTDCMFCTIDGWLLFSSQSHHLILKNSIWSFLVLGIQYSHWRQSSYDLCIVWGYFKWNFWNCSRDLNQDNFIRIVNMIIWLCIIISPERFALCSLSQQIPYLLVDFGGFFNVDSGPKADMEGPVTNRIFGQCQSLSRWR